MTNITVPIPDELYSSLTTIAKEVKRSDVDIIQYALKAYLQELQEDIEDIKDAEEILKSLKPGDRLYSLEEITKLYGLED